MGAIPPVTWHPGIAQLLVKIGWTWLEKLMVVSEGDGPVGLSAAVFEQAAKPIAMSSTTAVFIDILFELQQNRAS
jgi:hypothetical protein